MMAYQRILAPIQSNVNIPRSDTQTLAPYYIARALLQNWNLFDHIIFASVYNVIGDHESLDAFQSFCQISVLMLSDHE